MLLSFKLVILKSAQDSDSDLPGLIFLIVTLPIPKNSLILCNTLILSAC
jgi:hypothetical protein